jgi:lysosomal acid phosphatase
MAPTTVSVFLFSLAFSFLYPLPSSSSSILPEYDMSHKSEILGVVVLARNGDRVEFYQDPKTYAGLETQTTALGEVRRTTFLPSLFLRPSSQPESVFLPWQAQSHHLGTVLRDTYLDGASPSFIKGMHTDLVDNDQVHVRVKAGYEGTVVFDSAIALLQGLFPPNLNNNIRLANGTTIVAPLGGYQYVPGKLLFFC